jgi:hypothetical protein
MTTLPASLKGDPARVLACVDHSAYASSVCDHAGWFASHPDVGVEVLHVFSSPADAAQADALVDRAVWRLREEGVGPVTSSRVLGSFAEVATRHDAGLIVMGKRGDLSDGARRTLGANVDALVRRCAKPLCLAPKVFLPIHRALVLMDANLSRRAALEFATSDFRLSAMPMDVVVIAGPDEDASPKVEWARTMVATASAEVFSLASDGLDDAVVRYMRSRAADVVIISRAVVAADPEARLRRIEERGLWGTRTPVLIC